MNDRFANFLVRAFQKYGNLYDYSLSEYKKFNDKIVIICKIHGKFLQSPNSHLNKTSKGCPQCSYNKLTKTLEEFIDEANIKHNCMYDYSKVNYINDGIKVEIICSKHGSFWCSPNNHIKKGKGRGCPNCSGRMRNTCNKFIMKSKEIHGERYDYSLVDYINLKTKVEIICKKHGIFKQLPTNHLKGNNCPECSYRISKPEAKWLDKFEIPQEYRQFYIKINNKRCKADGFDPVTNTIYEFLGDYWHGNPKVFPPERINHRSNKTMKKLYEEIMNKLNLLKQSGYNVIYVWENDFKNGLMESL